MLINKRSCERTVMKVSREGVRDTRLKMKELEDQVRAREANSNLRNLQTGSQIDVLKKRLAAEKAQPSFKAKRTG